MKTKFCLFLFISILLSCCVGLEERPLTPDPACVDELTNMEGVEAISDIVFLLIDDLSIRFQDGRNFPIRLIPLKIVNNNLGSSVDKIYNDEIKRGYKPIAGIINRKNGKFYTLTTGKSIDGKVTCVTEILYHDEQIKPSTRA